MQDAQTTQDYRAILLAGAPLIDIRTPVEFQQGAMPGTINLPLMNDDERAAVGTCYKYREPEAALAFGHQLVSGEIRQQRMHTWLDTCRQNPADYLCCARGGQRSHIVQQWLHKSGIDYPLIKGGYKALRQAVIQLTEELIQKPIVLIGGYTGSDKTQLVQQQPNGVDLEGLAHRRDSSFGRTIEPQLSQASFEDLLAAEMLKTDSRQDLHLWVLEDEGYMIGVNHLPECLRERMTRTSVAVMSDPFECRLERLREEYLVGIHHDFTHAYGESQGWQKYSKYLHHGLFTIRHRLDLQRFAELTTLLDEVLRERQVTGSTDAHMGWLVSLLNEYHDPMYRYQLEKKTAKIVLHGAWQDVADWLNAQ